MFKNKYIAARVDRRTYLKGAFKGKFTGRLDLSKSDPRQENFYDLEIVEGEIVTRQDQLVPWMESKEPDEFAPEPVFSTRLPGKIGVTLHYLNGEVKHFKIALKQIKLVDCHLSEQVYGRNDVQGTIEGLVCGYVLHHDMLVKEIAENSMAGKEVAQPEPQLTQGEKKIQTETSRTRVIGPVINPPPGQTAFFRVLGLIIGFGLLGATLFIAKNWLIMLFCAVGIGFLIRWLQVYTSRRYGTRISGTVTALAILLSLAGFAVYLSGYYSTTQKAEHSNYTALKKEAAVLLAQSRYPEALKIYDQLVDDYKEPSLLYQRAKCYTHMGKIAEAVADLRLPVQKGDTAATRLHDSINPVKKRQIGTVIRCNDGWISHSKSRQGTCSHHGGVKDWEEPVYEDYRQYE